MVTNVKPSSSLSLNRYSSLSKIESTFQTCDLGTGASEAGPRIENIKRGSSISLIQSEQFVATSRERKQLLTLASEPVWIKFGLQQAGKRSRCQAASERGCVRYQRCEQNVDSNGFCNSANYFYLARSMPSRFSATPNILPDSHNEPEGNDDDRQDDNVPTTGR